jgi:hypothetical protein
MKNPAERPLWRGRGLGAPRRCLAEKRATQKPRRLLDLPLKPRENLVKARLAPGTFRRAPALRQISAGGPMGRSDEYRRYAAECLEMASVTHEPKARATLLHMAQVWLRLAGQGELQRVEEKSGQGSA